MLFAVLRVFLEGRIDFIEEEILNNRIRFKIGFKTAFILEEREEAIENINS